jgi:hypothetical protein
MSIQCHFISWPQIHVDIILSSFNNTVFETYLIFGTLLILLVLVLPTSVGLVKSWNAVGKLVSRLRFHRINEKKCKLNSYTSSGIKICMSYDTRNLLNKFLNLKRLNSSIDNMPSIVDPFDLYPPSPYRNNRNKLTSGSMINKISDLPNTSDMATELLDDLRIRQEELFKRIRRHPSKLDDA